MKIISKFTDFYEYDCYRYGEPDKSIVWVRESMDINKNVSEDCVRKIMRKYFLAGKATDTRLVNHKSGILQTRIDIMENLIGIYPYIYYYPQITFTIGFDIKYISIVDSIKCLTIPGYYKECFDKYNVSQKSIFIPYQILNAGRAILSHRNDGRNIKDPFTTEDIEVFNSEIFGDNKCPVFKMTHYTDYDNKMLFIKTNPCISSETAMLNIYFNELSNRDIYNDIENYMWANKQEPMSEPDNKTKILAHGFDTKTSFRKM